MKFHSAVKIAIERPTIQFGNWGIWQVGFWFQRLGRGVMVEATIPTVVVTFRVVWRPKPDSHCDSH